MKATKHGNAKKSRLTVSETSWNGETGKRAPKPFQKNGDVFETEFIPETNGKRDFNLIFTFPKQTC